MTDETKYDPNRLMDYLIGFLKLKNDAALARSLECAAPVISKVRHHHLPVGASLLIRMHDLTGLPIRDLRDMMGDRRERYRGAGVADKREPMREAA